jgi:hypothetical protein
MVRLYFTHLDVREVARESRGPAVFIRETGADMQPRVMETASPAGAYLQ